MPTEFLAVKNNAEGSLSAGVSDTDTSLSLQAGEGALFPSTYPFHVSIDDEIIRVNGKTGDTLTPVVRAQESTSAAAHSSGAAVELRVTAKHVSDLNAAVNTLEGTAHAQAHDHISGDGSGVLTDDEHDSFSEYAEIAAPATPAANKARLYPKDVLTVPRFFYKRDDGVEAGPLDAGPKTVVVRPGESIQAAFDAGYRHVILADGTHTMGANLTIPTDAVLEGEWRGVILSVGAFQVINNGALMALTVKNGTHPSFSVGTLGLIDFVIFDNCVRSLQMGSNGRVRASTFQNFAGNAAAGDAYCLSLSGGNILWTVEDCLFNAGPGVRVVGALGASIARCMFLMPANPAVASIEVGPGGGVVTGLVIDNCIYLSNASGSAGANAGHVNIGSNSVALGITVQGGLVVKLGNPVGLPPFVVRTQSDGTVVSGLLNPPGAGLATTDGIIIRAHRCNMSGLSLRGDGVGSGILIDGDYDSNIISSSVLRNFARGVDISSALANGTILMGLNLSGNVTAAYRDLGVGTQKIGLVTV